MTIYAPNNSGNIRWKLIATPPATGAIPSPAPGNYNSNFQPTSPFDTTFDLGSCTTTSAAPSCAISPALETAPGWVLVLENPTGITNAINFTTAFSCKPYTNH